MKHCFIVQGELKVTVVYVYVMNSPQHGCEAVRFVQTYMEKPPGYPHKTIVVLNGGEPNDYVRGLFAPLPELSFHVHDNSGYDIGGFQAVARANPDEDLMVFFGSSGFFKGPGWLARMVESFQKHGDALYGVMGNTGDERFNVYPHIRTTAFWISPRLLNLYPHRVTTPEGRYPFEHGPDCLTRWIRRQGLKALVVTWSGEYEAQDWLAIPNGFRSGDESAMLAGDRLNSPPYWPPGS